MPNEKNPRSRDFEILRQKMRCIYCCNEEYVVDDEDFWEIQEELQGAPYIEECKLYRYSKADQNNICNLCKQQVRLSKISDLNDMFEGLVPSKQRNLSPKEWEEIGEMVAIKCFSENWNNLLMWAHYADGGRGMCVEYDLKLLNKQDEVILNYLFPIHYSSERYIREDVKNASEELKEYKRMIENGETLPKSWWPNNLMAFYLTKSTEWEYEQEWRIIVPENRRGGLVANKKLKDNNLLFPCVSAVYLGCKMPEKEKRKIKEIVNRMNKLGNKDVEVYELLLEDSSYKLTAKNVQL